MQLFEQAPTSEELVAFIDTQTEPVRVRQICKHFGIKPARRRAAHTVNCAPCSGSWCSWGDCKDASPPQCQPLLPLHPQTVAAVQREQEVIQFQVDCSLLALLFD